MLRLAFLGRPRISCDGNSVDDFVSNKVVALLAYLATNEGDHPRERLAGMLWGEKPAKRANANLRMALYSIRQNLPESYFTITRTTAAFDPTEPYWLDVEILTGALHSQTDDPDRLANAVDLYRGDFLAGLQVKEAPQFEKWALTERERLRLKVLNALDHLIDRYRAMQQADDAIPLARRLLAIDPLREGVHRKLMQLLAREDRYNEALAQYDSCQQILADELGVAPMPETTTLWKRIKKERADSDTDQTGDREMPAVLTADDEGDKGSPDPVVARDRELTKLNALLEQTRTGNGRVAFIAGEAGSGKTTLAREFVRRAQARQESLLAATAQCTAYAGHGDPYHPFRRILQLLSGDVEGARGDGEISLETARRLWHISPATARALVERGPDLVGGFVSGSLVRRQVPHEQVDEVQANEDSDDELDQSRLFEQYTAVLTAVAADRPLVIVIEDAHWADASSLSLLFHLSQRIAEYPILLLGTYRPEHIQPDKNGRALLGDLLDECKRRYGNVVVDLDRRSPADGRRFIDELLDTEPNWLDEEFREGLFQHTGGHALFTIETLSHLRQQDALYVDEDGYLVAAADIDWTMIPAKVEGVIAQRVSRLPAEVRRALKIASVEGESFTVEVIAQVEESDPQELLRLLTKQVEDRHRLVQQEHVRYAGEQRLSGFRFRHHLFQQFIYRQLGDVERSHLHEQVGAALETLYGDATTQIASTLAYHFVEAKQFDKAAAYLLEAGNRARRLAANQEAIDHFAYALNLLQQLPDTEERLQRKLQLRIAQGNALMAARGYTVPEIEDIFLHARDLCRRLGDTSTLFPVLYGLHMYHGVGGRYEPALRYGDEFLQESRAHNAVGPEVVAHRTLAIILFLQGEFEAAHDHVEQLIAMYEPAEHHVLTDNFGQDPGVAGMVAGAWVLWILGYPDRALALKERAFDILDDWPDAHTRAYALGFSAALHQYRREPAVVQQYVEAAMALCQEKGFRFWLAVTTLLHGWTLAVTGEDVDAGIDMIRGGIEKTHAAGADAIATCFRGMLADAYRSAGEVECALETIDTALADGEERDEHCWEAELRRLRGDLLLDGGDVDTAEECLRQALEVAGEQSARTLELRVAVSLGRLLREQGDAESARALVAERYEWFEEGHETVDLREARTFLDRTVVRGA